MSIPHALQPHGQYSNPAFSVRRLAILESDWYLSLWVITSLHRVKTRRCSWPPHFSDY